MTFSSRNSKHTILITSTNVSRQMSLSLVGSKQSGHIRSSGHISLIHCLRLLYLTLPSWTSFDAASPIWGSSVFDVSTRGIVRYELPSGIAAGRLIIFCTSLSLFHLYWTTLPSWTSFDAASPIWGSSVFDVSTRGIVRYEFPSGIATGRLIIFCTSLSQCLRHH